MGQLSPAELALVEEFRALVKSYFRTRLDRLVLFGSRARGQGRDDSDLDVLVMVRDGARDDRRWIQDAAADVSLWHSMVLSPLFVGTQEWDSHPLRCVIDREGRVL